MILAEGGPAFGADYEFVDDTVEPGVTYDYRLEDIDTSGISTLHGADACTLGVDPGCEPLAVLVPDRLTQLVDPDAGEDGQRHLRPHAGDRDQQLEDRTLLSIGGFPSEDSLYSPIYAVEDPEPVANCVRAPERSAAPRAGGP